MVTAVFPLLSVEKKESIGAMYVPCDRPYVVLTSLQPFWRRRDAHCRRRANEVIKFGSGLHE